MNQTSNHQEMEFTTKTLSFTVSRKNPELIAPAAPTPHEFKPLSDIDDQDCFRVHIPIIEIYGGSPSISTQGKDPVKIIRDAIAKALVFFYPFAGRLRETATRKLLVECTAEGVLFIEADADVTAQQLPLHPPFPNVDQLLYDVPGSDGIIDCPLILFQVTRLKCGGFILAYRINHTMSDAAGFLRFVDTISELALGNEAPSIRPVWERHLLTARNPPRVSFPHQVYEPLAIPLPLPLRLPVGSLAERSFFFSAGDIAMLRRSLPPNSLRCSQFDLLAACIWRCRTMALFPNGSDEVRLSYAVGIGNKVNPPVPRGYYGNLIVTPTVVATVEELRNSPLQYIAELVRKARAQVTEEYVRSLMDFVVMKGRPNMTCNVEGSFVVSDLVSFRRDELDFGWGKPTYYGMAKSCLELFNGMVSWFMPWNTGILVPVCLPLNAMEAFATELNTIMEFARRNTTLSNL